MGAGSGSLIGETLSQSLLRPARMNGDAAENRVGRPALGRGRRIFSRRSFISHIVSWRCPRQECGVTRRADAPTPYWRPRIKPTSQPARVNGTRVADAGLGRFLDL